jgi:hypothetical protein
MKELNLMPGDPAAKRLTVLLTGVLIFVSLLLGCGNETKDNHLYLSGECPLAGEC